MSNISVDYDVLNQKQTPAFYASSLATRPTFGYPGRIFIDTDSPSSGIYRDTGSAWVQVADPGAGTTGTLQQVTTNGNTTNLAIQVQGIDISKGAGTGVSNTAVGTSALSINTTGYINVAVGYQALQNNTTGYANIGIGQQSLLNNSTGNSNTGVGNGVLSSNNTGNNNTGIGNGALSTNSTGNNNTAIGVSSLGVNTTGLQNTAYGSAALLLITTGSNNSAIGYASGSAITTGSNNIIIGSYIGTTTLTNNIVLSDGQANVRLYSNATGLIGINQAVGTPSAQVDIHTTQTYGLAVNGTTNNNAYLGFANAGTYKWRIGNNYNAGANSYDIYNVGTTSNAMSINSTTNNVNFGGTIGNGTYTYTLPSATGTLALTSALSSYLPLTGGTLTGALSGTSATFSSSVVSTQLAINTTISDMVNIVNVNSSGRQGIRLDNGINATGGIVLFNSASSTGTETGGFFRIHQQSASLSQPSAIFRQDGSADILQLQGAAGAVRLTIASTGAATFSSSVTALSGLFSNSGNSLAVTTSANSTTFMSVGINSGTNKSIFGFDVTDGGFVGTITNDDFIIRSNNTKRVTISASTGAATFSSSVTATSYITSSDYRLKNTIAPMSSMLDKIALLKPCTYNLNADDTETIGFIAHEVAEIIPLAVIGEKDGEQMQGIDYSKIVAVLVKAIQELNEKLVRNNIN